MNLHQFKKGRGGSSQVIIIAVLVGLAVIFISCFYGWRHLGAQTQAVSDQIRTKADQMVGTAQVKRVDLVNAMSEVQTNYKRARKEQIRCEETAKVYQRQLGKLEQNQTAGRASIGRLRDAVKANKPATLGGQQYSLDQLSNMLKRRIAAYKATQLQMQGYRRAIDALQARAVAAKQSREKSKNGLNAAKNALMVFDAQSRASSIGNDHATLSPDQLQKFNADLDKLRKAQQDAEIEGRVASRKEIPEAPTGPTIEEIDRMSAGATNQSALVDQADALLDNNNDKSSEGADQSGDNTPATQP